MEINSRPDFAHLPVSVLDTICKGLDPLSAIRLGQTCKALRSQLRTGTQRAKLWRRIRLNKNIISCQCPNDSSEAQWTHLLYWGLCMVCGRLADKVVWGLHARLCTRCERCFKTWLAENTGTDETYVDMISYEAAFVGLIHRRVLRNQALNNISIKLKANESRDSAPPVQLRELTDFFQSRYDNFLAGYAPSNAETLHISSRLMPLASDLYPKHLKGPTFPTLLPSTELLSESLRFKQLIRGWVNHVQSGLALRLPGQFPDIEAATSVWRPVDTPQREISRGKPTWWPHAAHMYLQLSQPRTFLDSRRPVGEVLAFDERGSDVVKSILSLLGLKPRTTTRAVLDARQVYVQCSICSSDTSRATSNPVLHWRHAVAHAVLQHDSGHTLPAFALVAPDAREQAAARDEHHKMHYAQSWTCAICAWGARIGVTRSRLEHHLCVVHEIEPDVFAADLAANGGYGYLQPTADSLSDLACPVSASSLSQLTANGLQDEIVSDPIAGEMVRDGGRMGYVWCLHCPVALTRIRRLRPEALRPHLRDIHQIVRQLVRDTDYAVL
ncbi:hypothetical protein BKA62DRAFT_702764 [Auriculariales sp. MPI-PUGE-AT-0066]|nr:hypothetical protein BKA62DRAFT_702764 [Auriculariales sp. MPI-PUGE-AT-0066]